MGRETGSNGVSYRERIKLLKRYRRRRAGLVAATIGTGFADIFLTTATTTAGHPIRGIIYFAVGAVLTTVLGVGAKAYGNKIEE